MYREILSRLGEDPDRDGLRATPERVEKALAFLTKGYEQDAAQILRDALFEVDYDEMVIVRDIEMFSLCEHHMLPFFRQGARGLYSQGQGDRAEQDCAPRRGFRAPLAGAGAAHEADCGFDPGGHCAAGRGPW